MQVAIQHCLRKSSWMSGCHSHMGKARWGNWILDIWRRVRVASLCWGRLIWSPARHACRKQMGFCQLMLLHMHLLWGKEASGGWVDSARDLWTFTERGGLSCGLLGLCKPKRFSSYKVYYCLALQEVISFSRLYHRGSFHYCLGS